MPRIPVRNPLRIGPGRRKILLLADLQFQVGEVLRWHATWRHAILCASALGKIAVRPPEGPRPSSSCSPATPRRKMRPTLVFPPLVLRCSSGRGPAVSSEDSTSWEANSALRRADYACRFQRHRQELRKWNSMPFLPRGSLKTGHRGSLQNRTTITIIQGVDFDARAATLGRCEQCLERGKETASYRIGAVGLVAAEDSEDQRRSARNGR